MAHDHSAHAHMAMDGGSHEDDARVTAKLGQVADAFAMDRSMLWKEIVAGFVIAGFLAVLVPNSWWQALFLQHGPTLLRLIENALVGPLIAVASFVCSIGNIPLASILWAGGIRFGGVIAFIYADLIVIPLIITYNKYYGLKAALYITGVMYVSMVLAGIIVDLVFSTLQLVPTEPRPPSPILHASFTWNYTTWRDIIAIIVAGVLAWLHYRRKKAMPGQMAHDSVGH